MDPGCVLGRFRVPVQGPVRGERPMHATTSASMRISPYFYLMGFYGSFSQYESDITDISHL
jgi:hypothetical protein